MKNFIITNFYFGLMLPPAKVDICIDIIGPIEQSDQNNHISNAHTFIFRVSISAIFYYIGKSILRILCYMNLPIG